MKSEKPDKPLPASDSAISRLLDVMSQLRDPEQGCVWDRAQTFETIVPHTIEEAYEVAETIANGQWDELKGELGDLLFQVVFYCQLAKEKGWFEFEQVAEAMADKLIRRHPHVFADSRFETVDEMMVNWEVEKAKERAQRAQHSVLDDVPQALPALSRAAKLQKRCAQVGFDWGEPEPVIAKIHEEIDEVLAEMQADTQGEAAREKEKADRLEDEVGDLLFAVTNLARHLKLDPEAALRRANGKFERRFRGVEEKLRAQGLSPEQSDLQTMDALWDQVKRDERGD